MLQSAAALILFTRCSMENPSSMSLEQQLLQESEKLKSLTAHFVHLNHSLKHGSEPGNKQRHKGSVSPQHSSSKFTRSRRLPHDDSSMNSEQVKECTQGLDLFLAQANAAISPTAALAPSEMAAGQTSTQIYALSAAPEQLACSPLLSRLSASHRAAVTPTAGAAQTVTSARAKYLHHEKDEVLRHQWEALLGRKLSEHDASSYQLQRTISSAPHAASSTVMENGESANHSAGATSTPDSPLRLTESQMANIQTEQSSVREIEMPGQSEGAWALYRPGSRPAHPGDMTSKHAEDFNDWLRAQAEDAQKPQKSIPPLATLRQISQMPKFAQSPVVHASQLQPLPIGEAQVRLLEQPSVKCRTTQGSASSSKLVQQMFRRANAVKDYLVGRSSMDARNHAGRVDMLNTQAARRRMISDKARRTVDMGSSPHKEFLYTAKASVNAYESTFSEIHSSPTAELPHRTLPENRRSVDFRTKPDSTSPVKSGRPTNRKSIWNSAVQEVANEAYSLMSEGWYSEVPGDSEAVVTLADSTKQSAHQSQEAPLKGIINFLIHRATYDCLPESPALSPEGRMLWEALTEEAALLAGGCRSHQATPPKHAHPAAANQTNSPSGVQARSKARAATNDNAKATHTAGTRPALQANKELGGKADGSNTHTLRDGSDLKTDVEPEKQPKTAVGGATTEHAAIGRNTSHNPNSSSPVVSHSDTSKQQKTAAASTNQLVLEQQQKRQSPMANNLDHRSSRQVRAESDPLDISSFKVFSTEERSQPRFQFGYLKSETMPLEDESVQSTSMEPVPQSSSSPEMKALDLDGLPRAEPAQPLQKRQHQRRSSTGMIRTISVSSGAEIRAKKRASLDELRSFAETFDHSVLDGITSEELLAEVLDACDDIEVTDETVAQAGESSSSAEKPPELQIEQNAQTPEEGDPDGLLQAVARIALPTIAESDSATESDSDSDSQSEHGKSASSNKPGVVPEESPANQHIQTPKQPTSKPAKIPDSKYTPNREDADALRSTTAGGDTFAMAREKLGLKSTENAPVRKLARMYSLAAKSAMERQAIVEHARRVLRAREAKANAGKMLRTSER